MKLYTNEIEKVIEEKMKPNIKKIYEMKREGYSDRQISRVLGISLKQFMEGIKLNEDIGEAYGEAMQILKTQLRKVVIDRALGIDGKVDKDGIEVGPDSNLAMRILEKIDPEFKREKTEVNVTMTVEHIIHEINERRRIEEEKAEEIEAKWEVL